MANPGQVSLATLRQVAQSYADLVNDVSIPSADWLNWINNSYFELYDKLVTAYGQEYYFATPYVFTSDGVSDTFGLPDGSATYPTTPTSGVTAAAFYKLLGVDIQLTGASGDATGTYIALKPFPMAERNRYNFPYLQAVYPGVNRPRYRLRGNNIWLQPLPKSAVTFRIWYAPRLTPLVSDTDLVDGISGWEDYIEVDAALKARDRREEDVSVLAARKAALDKRVDDVAALRDENGPMIVADTRYGNSFITPSGFFDNDYY